jgi:hypothetical protein
MYNPADRFVEKLARDGRSVASLRTGLVVDELARIIADRGVAIRRAGGNNTRGRYWWHEKNHAERVSATAAANELRKIFLREHSISLASEAASDGRWLSLTDAVVVTTSRNRDETEVAVWVENHLETDPTDRSYLPRRDVMAQLLQDLPGSPITRGRELSDALRVLDLIYPSPRGRITSEPYTRDAAGRKVDVIWGVRWLPICPAESATITDAEAMSTIPSAELFARL